MQRTVSTTIKIVDEASAELQQIKNEVQQTGTASAEMQKMVDGISGTLNEAQSASESFKSQIRELREAMAQMLADGVQPTDEQFQALARRAGQLEDAMGDANAIIKDFASDTHNLDKYTSGVQGLASAYGIYVSALNLVGIEDKKVEQAMRQLMAVQTLLNSVQQLSNQLQNQSSGLYKAYHAVLRMVGLEKKKLTVATTENTAATVAEGVATQGVTLATKAATLAVKGFKVALASTGIGAIVVGLGELISKIYEHISAVKDEEAALKSHNSEHEETLRLYEEETKARRQALYDKTTDELTKKQDELNEKFKEGQKLSREIANKRIENKNWQDTDEIKQMVERRHLIDEEYQQISAELSEIRRKKEEADAKKLAEEQAKIDAEKLAEYKKWLAQKEGEDREWAKMSEDLQDHLLQKERENMKERQALREKDLKDVEDKINQQLKWNEQKREADKKAAEEEAQRQKQLRQDLEAALSDKKEKYEAAFNTIYSGTKSASDSIKGLVETLNSEGTAWEKVSAVVDTSMQLYQAISGVIQAVQAAQQAAATAKQLTSQQTIAANSAETTSNIMVGASGYMAAHSAIPWVGLAIGLASVAAMIATMATLPKFAKGGIAYGPTLGLFGEYSNASTNPEVVAPLDRLRSLIGESSGANGNVTFRIDGRSLVGVLEKEQMKRNRS